MSFQFIEFPSEWGGEQFWDAFHERFPGFQFIEFPSEWGGKINNPSMGCTSGFQFIEFPSEWGVAFSQLSSGKTVLFPIY